MNRVVLIVDNPSRDLGGLLLIAAHLASRGIRCYLFPMNLIFHQTARDFWSLNPDFVLLPHLRKTNSYFAKQLILARIPFGVLDTEGMFVNDRDFLDRQPKDLDLEKQVSFYCCWGKDTLDRTRRLSNYSEGQLLLTGCPRYDGYSVSFRDAIYPKAKRDSVLIVSNFPTVNPRYSTPEREIELHVKLLKYSREHIEQIVQAQRTMLDGFIKLTSHLSKAFPDTHFLYRPHPFENTATYEKNFEGLENVEIVSEGPMAPLLFRSLALIHRESTSAFDAIATNIPALMPQWLKPMDRASNPERVSHPSANQNELDAQIRSLLAGNFQSDPKLGETQAKTIEQVFYQFDGKASLRVAEEIVKRVSSDPIRKHKAAKFAFQPLYHYSLAARIFWRLRAFIGRWKPLRKDFQLRIRSREQKAIAAWRKSGKILPFESSAKLIENLRQCPGFNPIRLSKAKDRTDFRFGSIEGAALKVEPDNSIEFSRKRAA